MAYKALYRKYRPNNFDEVVGQQHIVKTLQNAVKNNKIAHAYLFCGPRGTGKTSIAKILAKTINCTSDNKPCCQCENCLQIQEGSHPDVVELDAATNNGVDEVRDLIEKVKYSPMIGKYKVYIIDEVHMMTQSAFNALLKTLEEPPEYCVFILATTEPHKVLSTIISRCQRFDFNKISDNVIEGHLKNICEKENISISNEAIRLIAEIADGGMRDALSVLDQCVAYSQNDITAEDVSAVYGVTTTSEKIALIRDIKAKNTTDVMNRITEINNRGIDIKRLTIELIDIFKECVVFSYSKDGSLLKHLNVSQTMEILAETDTATLLRYIDYLMEAQSRYPFASSALVYFEVAVLKMIDNRPESIAYQPERQESVKAETKKPEKIIARKIRNYDDDQLYGYLCASTKALKETDSNGFTDMQNCTDLEYIARAQMLKGASIFADSSTDMIVVVKDRVIANNINDEENAESFRNMTEKFLGTAKNIIAITEELKGHLTTYFKARRDQEKKEQEAASVLQENIEPADSGAAKMEELFGKDGFTIIK